MPEIRAVFEDFEGLGLASHAETRPTVILLGLDEQIKRCFALGHSGGGSPFPSPAALIPVRQKFAYLY